jgi:uncharacterized phiE125 gp8 family phage protein
MAAYALTQYAAPATEPIGLDEAKQHLRVYVNDDDALIARLIAGARAACELATARQLVTATWELRLDGFPSGLEPIYLPLGKLQSVTHIKYLDSDGTEQTFSSANYRVGSYREPAEVTLAYQQSWPSLRGVRDQVTVRFVCGYGAAESVPQLLKQGMLLHIGSAYINREDIAASMSKLPRAAEDIFAQFALGDEFHVYQH